MYQLRQINYQGKGTAYSLIDVKQNRRVALLTNTKSSTPRTLSLPSEKSSGFELIRLQDHEKLNGLWEGAVISPEDILTQINDKKVDILTLQQKAPQCILRYTTHFGLRIYLTTDPTAGGWDYFTSQRRAATRYSLEDAMERADWEKPQGNMSIPGDMIISVDVVEESGTQVFKRRKYGEAPIRYKDEADLETIKASPKLIAILRDAIEEAEAKQAKSNPYLPDSPQFSAYEMGWSEYGLAYNEILIEAGL